MALPLPRASPSTGVTLLMAPSPHPSALPALMGAVPSTRGMVGARHHGQPQERWGTTTPGWCQALCTTKGAVPCRSLCPSPCRAPGEASPQQGGCCSLGMCPGTGGPVLVEQAETWPLCPRDGAGMGIAAVPGLAPRGRALGAALEDEPVLVAGTGFVLVPEQPSQSSAAWAQVCSPHRALQGPELLKLLPAQSMGLPVPLPLPEAELS